MCSVLEAIRSEITTDVSWKNNAFVGFWLGVDVVPLKCKWSLHTTFLHHCTAAQIFFFLCFFHVLIPCILDPPPLLPFPQTRELLCIPDWQPSRTFYAGQETCHSRHKTPLFNRRFIVSACHVSRLVTVAKSEVRWTNLQDNDVSANATCSNPASQSILNSQTNFFSFFFVWELSMILKKTYYT